jgi:NAD(P)-dependent dehydrogenase (short-subunit alcohol dehydrogenase family)
MHTMRNKTAVVTGAGSGIGRATALRFAAEGMGVAICDVNRERLRDMEMELGDACLLAAEADVSDRPSVQAFADRLHERVPAIDVLVNNAGVGLSGSFLSMSLEDWDWIIGINLMGVINVSHAFIPKMAERGHGGHIVNIASMAAYFDAPEMSGYCAAKHAVFGFSECLREDLRSRRIGVSVICPGIIKTDIIAASRMIGRDESLRGKIQDSFTKRNYGPERVAAAIVKAIRHNKAIVPVSPESWTAYYLNRLSPAASRALARWLHRKIDG